MPDRLPVIAILAALAMPYPAFAGDAAGDHRERLADLVVQDCGSCHGLTLKGGLGRPITPQALEHMDVETVTAIVLDGLPGTAMPPWRGLVSDADARWIAEGLKEGRFQ